MSYGMKVSNPLGGLVLVDQSLAGGRIFVAKIERDRETSGTTTVYTFPEITSGTHLRILQSGAGAHTWTTGTNGSGQATVTLTSSAGALVRASKTVLYVFTTNTVEPSYGLQSLNDAGQRLVSSVFPCPEYLGKLTFNSTPTSSADTGSEGYWRYTHTTSSTIGAGRNRLVLWSLPSLTVDCWFRGTNFVSSAVTGTFSVSASFYTAPGTSYTLPEAYVFALDGLTQSSDTYGLRVYGNSGELLFDAGRVHMVIKGFETTVDYPSAIGTTNTYASLSTLSGSTAMLVPDYVKEVWTNNGINRSSGDTFLGVMRKNGSTLYTRLIQSASATDDALVSYTEERGLKNNLTQVVIDTTLY